LAPSQLIKAFHALGEDGLVDQGQFITLMQEKGQCYFKAFGTKIHSF